MRVWGVDAPEAGQSGWDRMGMRVPIGRQSSNALADYLGRGFTLAGQSVGSSYGRTVGPVTSADGIDLGNSLLRSGHALTAPQYLRSDPERLRGYQQSERLARLNGLGQHDTFAQSPAEYRADPDYVPDRETVAQFFDTPTPLQGLPADKEQQLRHLYATGTAAEINAFLSANGYQTSRPADLAAFIRERDKGAKADTTVSYTEAPPLMIDSGDGVGGAIVRKGASGFLAGGLDELGAVVDTLGGTGGRESVWNSDRRLVDIWSNNQRQNAGILAYDQTAHPVASTTAEIGGGILGGFVIPYGQGARTIPELAKVGGVFGGATGFLGTDGNVADRSLGAVQGTLAGALATPVIGKAVEYALPVVRSAIGRGATRAADDATAASGPLVARNGPEAPTAAPAGNSADPWAAFPDAEPPASGRVVDRIDVGPARPRVDEAPLSALDTAYPGPVPGKAPPLADIMPELEAWAARQGDGVMLHGSKTPDIQEFDPYAKSGYGLFGQGTYLTDNATVAAGYSAKGLRGADPSGRTIYAAEQRVANPLDMDAPADLAAWQRVAGDEADFEPGMTNAEAYRSLEDSMAGEMVPMWEGAERMADAVRALGHDGITHRGGKRFGKGDGPDHRVVIALDPEQTIIRDRFDLGQRLQPQMRDRDWIDISQTPPQPRAIGMDVDPLPSISAAPRQRDYIDISAPSRPRPMGDDYTSAERVAAAERVGPRDVLPMPGNTVADAEEAAAIAAGRYGPAKAPNERELLDRGTVRGLNGPVPKVGPVDMVGWLRLHGGLAPDDGGELSAIGLTNAARRGLDHVGQETRFGPLVHDQGMTLDDAALAAWEAGYFPEHSTRPDVNTFLDALRGTYDGYRRRWLPEDMGQVDAFDAARQERQALDAMKADGPVWDDRSVPAAGDQPFAPPEAYDDASREAIRRVGNLDVSKLDSPQDIARALKTTHNAMGGFDAATRGTIAHAETERLAADLGMTADKLLARRKGEAFNAEEALAARQILAKAKNDLVNAAKAISGRDDPGEDLLADFQRKLTRSIAIQEQVAGMTAEAGRALQQFRQVADSRAVRTDVLGAIVAAGGGKDRLRQAATALVDMVERDPGKFIPLAEKLARPKWRDKVAELYINFLLSNPATHAVNVVSNTLTSIAQVPEFAAGAVIGGVRRAVMGEKASERILASEVGARAFGLLQGAKEGARMFAQALKTGEASDFVSKVEGQQYKAISGLKGEAIRLPTRFLTAEDELFKGIARRMELNAEAVRIARKEGLRGAEAKARIAELVADPTDEMLERAMDYGRYLTFQRKLGPFAQKVSGLTGDALVAKIFLPFVRTPTNLIKFAAERSPAAPLLKEWRDDFLAGGDRRDMAIARMMIGTGFGYAMFQAAAEGHLTGSPPADPAKARLLYADGWKPYSVKIGGTYYSYKRLDPFATTIGVAADLALMQEGMTEKQREDKTTLLVASIMGNMSEKTWLSGVSDFVSALHEPERYAGDLKNRIIASFLLPNVVGGTARALDPTARKVEGFTEELQSRVPFLRDNLLPKRDVWGRPIVNEGGLGPDFLSPIWLSRQLDDPVNHELLQLDYAPGVPSKKVGGRELSPAEYDRYVELAGKGSHAALSTLVRSPEWRGMDDEAKVTAARKAVADARRDARAQLGGATPGKDDPWSAFPDAGGDKPNEPDPWADFPSADERDVAAELSQAIPGIRFTSGYRDPEYNASLRARGYNPSDNSGHMVGSDLDMLPPPGRSLGWLKSAVRRYDPKARLLVHDGHLHGGFDGYYSAPKLGGMRGR